MNVINRINAPTPGLFKKIRNTGLALATISGVILASPAPLPQVIIKAAGYMAVAGGVASAVSQLTKDDDEKNSGNEPAV
jgi:hypothetical protein